MPNSSRHTIPAESLTIVIPARDEAPHIGRLVAEIRGRFPEAEIVVVDDGSADETGTLAAGAGASVLRHPYPLGNGAAVRRGIRASRREWVLLMDGDGQHRPDEIGRLLDGAEEYVLTVGARNYQGQTALRAFGNRIFNLLATYVSGVPVRDLTSGMRLYRRRAVATLLPLFPNGFSSPATGTLGILRSGLPVRFVPVQTGPGERPSHLNPWAEGVRFLMIIFRIATLYSPLKVFLPLASLLFFGGGLYLGWSLMRHQTFPPAALFTLTSAVLILGLGMLSEQISQLRFSRALETGDEEIR
ncbi:MAG: glycosyltransferase family 2 protein [Deltaproteobacteria bacterium]|nr:glycosyltransferase family 2 protein [Deltaproteobacteria bacterium]